jgi:tetratricopeptide (TPR) repeat protein
MEVNRQPTSTTGVVRRLIRAHHFLQRTMSLLLLALLLTFTSPTPTEDQINHHLEVGNNALAASDFPTAISHYKSCLDIDPNHRYCLINYASALVDSIDPNEEESSKEDANNRAIEMLRRVLESHPQDGDAAFNLAILLQDTSRSEEITREAAKLYQISAQSSLETGEQRWDAFANLASAQQELGIFLGPYGAHSSYERSIVYLERLTKQHQDYIHEILHSPHAAELEWDEAKYEEISVELWEMNHLLSKLYYGLGTILSELTPQDCLRLMDQDTLLINAMIEEDNEEEAKKVCNENAVNAMRMAVDLDPENRVAKHMLDAMVGEEGGGSKRASNEFVSGELILFAYHLTSHRVPGCYLHFFHLYCNNTNFQR